VFPKLGNVFVFEVVGVDEDFFDQRLGRDRLEGLEEALGEDLLAGGDGLAVLLERVLDDGLDFEVGGLALQLPESDLVDVLVVVLALHAHGHRLVDVVDLLEVLEVALLDVGDVEDLNTKSTLAAFEETGLAQELHLGRFEVAQARDLLDGLAALDLVEQNRLFGDQDARLEVLLLLEHVLY